MKVQVVELFELYTLCDRYCAFAPISFVRKVILFSIEGHCKVFELYSDKMLRVSNIGKMPFTILKDEGGENEHFDDIILYKEQLYVVDEMGTIFWINTLSLKLVQFSPKNFNCGEKRQIYNPNNKQLVEYDGNLYVVDIDDGRYYRMGCFLNDAFVKVYRFDQEWGKWLDVRDLGDVSFVLGKDSNFALLAQDYHGCQRNCIYFYFKEKTYCFNLDNLVFWPCPTLFHPVSMTS
jgi:hypothetical protein